MPGASAVARRQLESWFETEIDQADLDLSKLLTSELVNNAVLHGTGEIALRATVEGDRLVIGVLDQGAGFTPIITPPRLDQIGGRGLAIIDAAAARWGVSEIGAHVWFELELSER